MKTIEEEFGCPVSRIFSYVSDEPVAAASFGQVNIFISLLPAFAILEQVIWNFRCIHIHFPFIISIGLYCCAKKTLVISLQVYQGRTVDGALVAIKVQRPNLLPSVLRDIYILRLGVFIFLFAKT